MRDLKYDFVNSSTGPEVRDSHKNFVKPGKYSSGTFNSQWTIWLPQEWSKEFFYQRSQSTRKNGFFSQFKLVWTQSEPEYLQNLNPGAQETS
jgi:hypothetical protein